MNGEDNQTPNKSPILENKALTHGPLTYCDRTVLMRYRKSEDNGPNKDNFETKTMVSVLLPVNSTVFEALVFSYASIHHSCNLPVVEHTPRPDLIIESA